MPPTPLERYRSWLLKRSDVGCVFARFMAANPARFGQVAETIVGADATAMAIDIAQRIDRLVADPAVAAATLLFPEETTLEDLVNVALALDGQPGWHVTRTTLPGTSIGDAVAFGMVRDIPFQGAPCPSEALVLGPFDEFPETRRAPVTVLEIFVGVPPAQTPSGAPRTKANLADVDVAPVATGVFQSMWRNSVTGRRRSLNGVEDGRAKAKVAFVVPMTLATSLGCAP